MNEKKLYRTEFDYIDKRESYKRKDKDEIFTNKSTMRKFEFDYEEDPYEPGR